jgi:hypothetical protein
MDYSLLSILRKVRMNKLYSIAVYSYITITGYKNLEKIYNLQILCMMLYTVKLLISLNAK